MSKWFIIFIDHDFEFIIYDVYEFKIDRSHKIGLMVKGEGKWKEVVGSNPPIDKNYYTNNYIYWGKGI